MNTQTSRAHARRTRTLSLAVLTGTLLAAGLVSGPATAASTPASPTPGASSPVSVQSAPAPASPGAPTEQAAALPPHATERQLAPGVTHGQFTLGDAETTYPWVVQLTLPSGQEGVADSQVSSQQVAEQVAAELQAAGFDARAEAVHADRLADSGGYLGHRVRVGDFGTQQAAVAVQQQVTAETGYAAGTWYAGWDGDAAAVTEAGPVTVNVLTVDPRRFRGEVTATFGEDLERTETTSELAEGAIAGVNAGFFVFGDEHGAPGDPAGVGAYDGKILSESVGERPALVIDGRSGRARIERLTWEGQARSGSERIDLDGINREPGLIRNCGGTGDTPTDQPRHDVTCADTDETVVFTPEFGASTPAGAGLEVVVDHRGAVVEVLQERGTELRRGQFSLQATGADVEALQELADRERGVRLAQDYRLPDGRKLPMTPDTQVVNGGPNLLTDGRRDITAARDGMVHADNPGMFYGWVHQRNPRTIAGIDAQGRLVLVTADGRQVDSVGLSISEAADLAQQLGLRDAINLDGGGSTAMVVEEALVNSPSGGAERAVGDAIVIRGR
ncbi:MAG: phosphodiester glycosidase family protein [Micrococcus sp.]|nr:phosphodiester glycosidase family protein [Micrococcus sp.]